MYLTGCSTKFVEKKLSSACPLLIYYRIALLLMTLHLEHKLTEILIKDQQP